MEEGAGAHGNPNATGLFLLFSECWLAESPPHWVLLRFPGRMSALCLPEGDVCYRW